MMAGENEVSYAGLLTPGLMAIIMAWPNIKTVCACVYVCPNLPNGDDDDMVSIRLVSGPRQI